MAAGYSRGYVAMTRPQTLSDLSALLAALPDETREKILEPYTATLRSELDDEREKVSRLMQPPPNATAEDANGILLHKFYADRDEEKRAHRRDMEAMKVAMTHATAELSHERAARQRAERELETYRPIMTQLRMFVASQDRRGGASDELFFELLAMVREAFPSGKRQPPPAQSASPKGERGSEEGPVKP